VGMDNVSLPLTFRITTIHVKVMRNKENKLLDQLQQLMGVKPRYVIYKRRGALRLVRVASVVVI
jgi:hypothetical protein